MSPIKQVVAAHPGLATKLRRFSSPAATRLVAALSLVPETYAQTIRIELLQHLVAVCCSGTREPHRNDLAEWAGKYMASSPYAQHEDPVEDVFVGCVNSSFGSFRVLMGVFADADFWVERLLAFLADKQNFPPFETGVRQAVALLKVSDAMIARLGLQRYTQGGVERAGMIRVPRWNELQPRAEAVAFSDADLSKLGTSRSELVEFLFTQTDKASLIECDIWSSNLERRPLIDSGDGVTVSMPSSLTRSCLRFLVEVIASSGMGGWADTFYQMESASLFVNDVASRLGVEKISFEAPSTPDVLPPLYPFFGQFDVGKPAILLTYCPSLVNAANDFAGHDGLDRGQEVALESYLKSCTAELEKLPGFSGGMVLVSMAGGLRSSILGINAWSPNWRVRLCTLPDWLCLTAGNRCTAMRLWKLGDHELLLEKNGTELLNLAGLPNLFAAWTDNGFRLLPRSQDARGLTMVTLDCVFACDLRVKTRRRHDAHCVRSHDDQRWIRVVRHNADPLFEEDANARSYVDPTAAETGRLLGYVEETVGGWWVVLESTGLSSEQRNIAFQLWECVFCWMERVARVAVREWPSLQAKGSIEIKIDLVNISDWRMGDHSQVALPDGALCSTVDTTRSKIVLRIAESFMGQFHTPKNAAEQRIVGDLLVGAAELGGAGLDTGRLAELVREVVRNDDARYFHFVRARRTEQLFAVSKKPRPLFVAEEDAAFSQLGLAHLLGLSGVSKIEGRDQCRTLLEEAVVKLRERIEGKLSRFDRASVALNCLHELDEIARDDARWDMAARSQFALRADSANVHEVLAERRAERDKASLCSRLLIEFAQYACNAGQRVFTQADYLALLADMALLVTLAQHRDGIAYGFIEPNLSIFPNGEIETDERFYAETFGRYMTKRSHERNEAAAEDYDNYFQTGRTEGQPDPGQGNDVGSELESVFVSEFGFPPSLLFTLLDKFRDFAVHTGQAHGVLSDAQMFAFLHHCGFSAIQANTFLSRFALPIRTGWDADLPPLSRKSDVFPWRFRRQMSLLSRPILQSGLNPRSWLVSVPLLEKGIAYFLGNLERASFPRAFFRSSEMHRYIGKTVNRRGHEFAGKVEAAFVRAGYRTSLEREMTKLGASKKDGLGDIDVLAWNTESGTVVAVECKRLLPAITVREVIQRLEDFRGNREEKDSLGRHRRRVDWLAQHLEFVAQHTGIRATGIHLTSLLVTSDTVPMQFFDDMDFPAAQVVPFDELEGYISEKLPPKSAKASTESTL